MNRRLGALALLLCALTGACSSTNRTTESVIEPEASEPAAAPARPAATAGAARATAASPSRTTGGRAAAVERGSSPSSGPAVRARTDRSPLKLGFIIIKGGDALVVNSLGTPVSFGDGKKQVNALVADLNKRGGINGRRVKPYFYEWNVADASDSPAVGCVKLTEDDHVFAILTVVNIDEEMAACAAKHKTLLINASFGAGDRYMYRQFGDWLFSPSLLLQNVQKTLLLQSLKKHGRLGKGVRVGVATFGEDRQYQRVTTSSIIPLLKSWKVPYSAFTFQTDADISAAVLRFRSDGVNLVIFSSSSAIPPLLFMRQADSQGWVPRYGMTDSDDTTTLGDYAPRRQNEGVTGVGAQPISNVAVNQYPIKPQEARCLAVMRAGGENDHNRRSSLTAEPYCEALWAFEAVATRVTDDLTSALWRTAFPSVRTSYKPITALATDFANGRHDNASQYREFAWKPSCTCMSYTTGNLAVPR